MRRNYDKPRPLGNTLIEYINRGVKKNGMPPCLWISFWDRDWKQSSGDCTLEVLRVVKPDPKTHIESLVQWMRIDSFFVSLDSKLRVQGVRDWMTQQIDAGVSAVAFAYSGEMNDAIASPDGSLDFVEGGGKGIFRVNICLITKDGPLRLSGDVDEERVVKWESFWSYTVDDFKAACPCDCDFKKINNYFFKRVAEVN